jgi:peptide/nickel transport system permease protein
MQGVGQTTVQAVNDLNLPIVMASVFLGVTFVVVSNVVVEMSYAVIDSRVRLG